MNKELAIQSVRVTAGDTEIIPSISLSIPRGVVAALMGPNGSGKSSLVNAIMGHPEYVITAGKIILDGEDITRYSVDEKAKKGLFLSFQYPVEISGVRTLGFLCSAYNAVTGSKISILDFKRIAEAEAVRLGIPTDFLSRFLNEGFSGGEKKRIEALQMSLFKPRYALLDETDAGLDADALKIIGEHIKNTSDHTGVLLITHHARMIKYIKPDIVYVINKGEIICSGDAELAYKIEKDGYKNIIGLTEGQ